jgi:hypothetical protein
VAAWLGALAAYFIDAGIVFQQMLLLTLAAAYHEALKQVIARHEGSPSRPVQDLLAEARQALASAAPETA